MIAVKPYQKTGAFNTLQCNLKVDFFPQPLIILGKKMTTQNFIFGTVL
ncbi:MAG: hypothetical protein JWP69_1551 [Flaviaesturariibacter sp.]|nr:hypothetical protein [Flaviaesturariibacter sp.]